MSRYFTRLMNKRAYIWSGEPVYADRKLRSFLYEGFLMKVEGSCESRLIKPGQFILVESDDDDNPYVAKLLKLYSDDSGRTGSKRAVVQWYMRFCEVHRNKRKLLGREPHPQEVFLFQVPSCQNDIDIETVLGSVQLQYVEPDAPFPETRGQESTLYVKMSWDGKAFKPADPNVIAQGAEPCRPAEPAAALATPDLAVMKRAVSVSTGKRRAREAESHHSASKSAQSKRLSSRRQGSCPSTPGVRKKLQLNSPGKSAGPLFNTDNALEEILQEEVQSHKRELANRLPSSPSRSLTLAVRLSPIKVAAYPHHSVSLSPLKVRLPPASPGEDQDSARACLPPLEEDVFEVAIQTRSSKTPWQKDATPRKSTARPQRQAFTPSRRKVSLDVGDGALGVLEEEDSPAQAADITQTAVTPRSQRKSAQLVASRIRKQLNLLNAGRGVDSDCDDDEDLAFTPLKKDLQTSSEEEEEGEGESDGDSVAVKKSRQSSLSRTPRSTRKARTPRKTPSRKATPTTPRTPRQATPSIPSRSLPARKPGNILEEARARLHVSSVPESLPCREQEFQDIYSFVESKIMDGTGGCMYISGVPGTGKTATVHEVMRCLLQAAEQDDIPGFSFIEINGMKMTDPHQAYVQILQKLTDQKATADHAATLLEKRFSTPAPKRETTVLLVDELDLLWTRKQNVMYNLFDWPTRRHAKLVVLAIANTMDLPERIMINRVASRLGLTRMSFQPYTFKQLQQIITSRLNRVRAFEEDALQLVSRKVAALSGDARRCLDICRRATEICEVSSSSAANGQRSGSGLVGMSHVMEALDEMFSSPYVTAIRCASLQEQLFLRAVIAEFRRLGLEEATFQQVFRQHQALCRVEGLQPVSVSEGLATCLRLGACRLLLLEPSRCDLLLRVRLNVSQDDVLYALKEE
ncbi:ORC1 protein, partial [Amia calva]|nr:ORC1 protein [Amia calva]